MNKEQLPTPTRKSKGKRDFDRFYAHCVVIVFKLQPAFCIFWFILAIFCLLIWVVLACSMQASGQDLCWTCHEGQKHTPVSLLFASRQVIFLHYTKLDEYVRFEPGICYLFLKLITLRRGRVSSHGWKFSGALEPAICFASFTIVGWNFISGNICFVAFCWLSSKNYRGSMGWVQSTLYSPHCWQF